MESIELIRDNLVRSESLVLRRVEDMRAYAMVTPTSKGGCHTLWVLGHLAYIETLVIRHFMLGESNPLSDWAELFDGAEVSQEPSLYPPFDTVLAKCRGVRADTLALLDTLSEGDLDAASAAAPREHDDPFGNRRRRLQYVADHWYMHRGQLADARRTAGLERMWL
ncbi:MAG: DinB family protein [Gemmatimonadetes bacterium]|nr:DinB family protein [Gemmatimonadota bacterium]